MTSTEIAVRQPGGVAVTERDVVDGWITVVADVAKLSDHIAETDFVPKALRNKPAAIAACILTGRELGIGPMASLKSIHMVQGVPSLSAEYKRARALAAGHQIVVDESTATRCVVRGRRAGAETWVTIAWTMDMAKRAKLSGKDVWQAYPQRMLQARATSELCDLLFPDATLGLPTTEELEDGGALAIAIGTEVTAEAEAAEPVKPPARTARRARPVAADKPAPQPPPAASAPEKPSGPPLPGEEETPSAADAAKGPPSRADAAEGPDQTDYDTPGTVTSGQLAGIWATFKKDFGFSNDDDDKVRARQVCAHVIGRPIGSTRDMSWNEAKAVRSTQANLVATAQARGEQPMDVLLAMMTGELAAAVGAQDGGGHDGS